MPHRTAEKCVWNEIRRGRLQWSGLMLLLRRQQPDHWRFSNAQACVNKFRLDLRAGLRLLRMSVCRVCFVEGCVRCWCCKLRLTEHILIPRLCSFSVAAAEAIAVYQMPLSQFRKWYKKKKIHCIKIWIAVFWKKLHIYFWFFYRLWYLMSYTINTWVNNIYKKIGV